MRSRAISLLVVFATLASGLVARAAEAQRLTLGVVQMVPAPTLTGNRDRIVSGIADAAKLGARVVVFPEGVLTGKGSEDLPAVDEAVAAIRAQTRQHNVYVLFGAHTRVPKLNRGANWMLVLAPDGRDVMRYDKLYDQPNAAMPGVFEIDGVPCNAMICADRWLRGLEEVPILQGAKVSFELSNNSWVEWVAPLEWYWYVPRAVRNNVWVVFANTGNFAAGVPPHAESFLRHGHSAIIAPNGRVVSGTKDDAGTTLISEIDVREATRAEAFARANHPALRSFWADGVKRQAGAAGNPPEFTAFNSPAIDVTIAAAQVVNDFAAMEKKIGEARRRGADLVVFPARAAPESALARLQAAACENGIVVVFGAEHRTSDGRTRNSAFAIGPNGALLTRYDQLSAQAPSQPGTDPTTMWFRVKGVPAVVTIGRDGLWSEIAELAAAAGAQIHLHLDHDATTGEAAILRQQVWANLASFQTFTATVNLTGSAIWDDMRAQEERRAPVGTQLPESGAVEIYSQYSANLVVSAKSPGDLIVATRRVNAANNYHTRTTARKNPQMAAWYRLGAAMLQGGRPEPRD